MRIDIPEGAEVLPKFGWGRVLSRPDIAEWYFTIALFGHRLFIARGDYGWKCGRMFRWWTYPSNKSGSIQL